MHYLFHADEFPHVSRIRRDISKCFPLYLDAVVISEHIIGAFISWVNSVTAVGLGVIEQAKSFYILHVDSILMNLQN